MKKALVFLILLFSYSIENSVFADQNTPMFSNLSLGVSNQLFRYNGEGYNTTSPNIEFKLLKRLSVLSRYERYSSFKIVDISNVRDGQPRVIHRKNTYQHIPLALKYCFINKQKIGYYLKISGINQFGSDITSVYNFNEPTQISKQKNHNMLYGVSVGFDFIISQKNKVGLETYFKSANNIDSGIFGVSFNYMFNLKINK